jgi:MFS transporter, BCD family, chlorophyll transporter
MYVTLLVGTIVSALVFGAVLQDFSPARLVQVIQAAAVVTLVLNTVALWKQEGRNPRQVAGPRSAPSFGEAWRSFVAGEGARRRLSAIGLGTMAFGMQDVLLEPYGGHVLGMAVGDTTWLTATLATGGLVGFGFASRVLGRGADPARMAVAGAWVGVPAFAAVLLAALAQSVALFFSGALLIGIGAGVFGHGTLTLTMNRAPREQIGLALGAWGAVQALAAGTAVACGGLLRDAIDALATRGALGEALAGHATGYSFVYHVEIALLFITRAAIGPLVRSPARAARPETGATLGLAEFPH